MRPDRHFERRLGFVEGLLLGVEDGQIVVGLWQLRVILCELAENADRVFYLVQFGEGDGL